MFATHPRTSQATKDGIAGARRGFVLTLALAVAEMWRTHRDRRTLASLPDHMLHDIGLSRADIDRELSRPAWSRIDYESLEATRHRAVRGTRPAERPR